MTSDENTRPTGFTSAIASRVSGASGSVRSQVTRSGSSGSGAPTPTVGRVTWGAVWRTMLITAMTTTSAARNRASWA